MSHVMQSRNPKTAPSFNFLIQVRTFTWDVLKQIKLDKTKTMVIFINVCYLNSYTALVIGQFLVVVLSF